MLVSLRKVRNLFLAAALGSLFVACTDDEKKPDTAVEPNPAVVPAAPPEESTQMLDAIYFDFDSSVISSDNMRQLDRLAEMLKSNDSMLDIEGHCDERGTTQYNLALGERRAHGVKKYLAQMGVAENRMRTISYGKERPKVEGHDEAAWSKNRRAEFKVGH